MGSRVMGSRVIAASGAAVTVVLSAATMVVKDRLNGGWGWWIALAAVVLASASVTAWLIWHASSGAKLPAPVVGAGAIHADRDITDSASTRVTGVPGDVEVGGFGPGSISARRDIAGPVSTKVDYRDNTVPGRP